MYYKYTPECMNYLQPFFALTFYSDLKTVFLT